MSDYGWIITTDHLDGPKGDTGLMGPADITDDIKTRLLAGEGEPFQLLDDDNELYYTGLLIGGDGSEPLDDYGAPGAGCTTLQQQINGRWETVIG